MKLYLNDHLQELDLAEALTMLSPQRREQALRFRHELGQRTCAAAYLLLCRALREEYGIAEAPLLGYGEHGKPYLIGHEDIHFNLSHCREAAVCAVSDKAVGVDVETVRPVKDALLEYTMNEREVALIRAAADPALAFTRLWTQKEAVLKLTGEGINNHLKEVLCREDVTTVTHASADGRYVYSISEYA